MELDSGASVSIIGEGTMHRDYPNLSCEFFNVPLRSYAKDPKPMLGETMMSMKYKDKQFELPPLVTQGNAPWLLGCNWMEALNLPVFNIGKFCSVSDFQQL